MLNRENLENRTAQKLTSLTGCLLLILLHVSSQSFFLIFVYLDSMVRVHSLEPNSLNSNLGFTSGKVTFCPSVLLLVRNIPSKEVIVVAMLKDV